MRKSVIIAVIVMMSMPEIAKFWLAGMIMKLLLERLNKGLQ